MARTEYITYTSTGLVKIASNITMTTRICFNYLSLKLLNHSKSLFSRDVSL